MSCHFEALNYNLYKLGNLFKALLAQLKFNSTSRMCNSVIESLCIKTVAKQLKSQT